MTEHTAMVLSLGAAFMLLFIIARLTARVIQLTEQLRRTESALTLVRSGHAL